MDALAARVQSLASTAGGLERVSVVVPACDEADRVARVIATIPPWVVSIVLVDDGSRDATVEVARAVGDPRLVVLSHPVRMGVGRAIETGYRRAFEDGATIVAVMAGDAQMDPADLAPVVAAVRSGGAGYAKGNRFAHPSAKEVIPTLRRLGGKALSALTRVATGLDVEDSQCGYTALSARAWRVIRGRAGWAGYGYPNDLLVRLARAGVTVVDVPVRPVYVDKRGGMRARHALLVPWVLARALAI
jgi:glycosyltransferase involved in cell wall biosynthesis